MKTIKFTSLPPRCDSSTTWVESNRSLARLIDLHRPALGRAIKTAEKISRRMASLFPLLDALCGLTCPWCPTPCCIFNKVWIDFNDLLFMHLAGQPIPPLQLTREAGEACCYLTHRGCLLPRPSRPWACTLYVCGTQHRALRKSRRFRDEELKNAIQSIKSARLDMEAALVRAVSQKNLDPKVKCRPRKAGFQP